MKTTMFTLLTVAGMAMGATPAAAQNLIKNRGSDTMIHVAQAWAEAYHKNRQDVTIDVRGCGSVTGITGLINGTVDIANASRPMNKKELAEAQSNGVTPRDHLVGYDSLAVYVHKNNPLDWISVKNLAETYGEGGFIDDWSKLGVMVPGCTGNKIHLVGRAITSGTHAFFQDVVLGAKRDFKHHAHSTDLTDSEEVLELVAKDPCAIGYSGMAYDTPQVKKLKIARETGSAVIEANMENAVSRAYPLARPLFMITNGEPTGEIKAYLDWIQSDQGQCLENHIGYAPVRPVTCK